MNDDPVTATGPDSGVAYEIMQRFRMPLAANGDSPHWEACRRFSELAFWVARNVDKEVAKRVFDKLEEAMFLTGMTVLRDAENARNKEARRCHADRGDVTA